MKDVTIIIPARRDSRGFPHKNQRLLPYTLNTIPIDYHKNIVISTNDESIIATAKSDYSNCRVHYRSEEGAVDTASTRECVAEVIDEFSSGSDIIMLYLTYPERRWSDVVKSYEWYLRKNASSLLCRHSLSAHPYLCMYEMPEDKGKQIISHDLYRRQDYPECFRISHMISIFRVEEFEELNNNLYNENTVYYKISNSLDVDTLRDFEKIGANDG